MNESNNMKLEYKGWHVVRRIGTGSFGSVYEIEREDFGYTYKAALKVISIPRSDQDLKAVKNNVGKSEDSLAAYYQSVAAEIVKEFELMYQLRGTTNIVSYEDHEVRKHENDVGWDIMIRMELLTPLDTYTKEHVIRRQDVIRLGIDICKALERCRALDIIHRDIKPGNIFISDQGDFKLGDFGIARTIEAHDDVLELSRKGTISYMAPEIFRGMPYSFDVDLYSLGIVMYRLLNNNSLPFVPQPPAKPTYKDISNANQLRLRGESLPYPSGDHTQLADIVLKACSYRPEDRYQNPVEMRRHLEQILRDEHIDAFDDNETILLETPTVETGVKHNKGKGSKVLLGIVLIAAIGIFAIVQTHKSKDRSYDDCMTEAQQYLDNLKYEEAEQSLIQAIEVRPTEKTPYIILAEVYVKDNKSSEAVDILEKAVDNAEMDESEIDQVKTYIKNVQAGMSSDETDAETEDNKDGDIEQYITMSAPVGGDASSSYGDIELLNGPDNQMGDGIYVSKNGKTAFLADEDRIGYNITTDGKNVLIYSISDERNPDVKVKIYRYDVDAEKSECIGECESNEYFQLAGYYNSVVYYSDGIGGGTFNAYSLENQESKCLIEEGAAHVWQSKQFFVMQSNSADADSGSELQIYNAVSGESDIITQRQYIRGNVLSITDDAVYYVEFAENSTLSGTSNVNICKYLLDGSGREVVVKDLAVRSISVLREHRVEYYDNNDEEQEKTF